MPGDMGVEAVQTIFLLLLVFVAVFAGLAHRLKLAYPIVLVVAGLLVSFIPGTPRIRLNPDLVFLVFLPPLVYAAAWTLSWREFQRNFGRIAMLALGLVTFTVVGTAGTAGWFLPGFDWRSGFLLGAVVAATDPIAATSIARRMGLPRRIVEILEAESLVNDGTGLLALQFGLMILMQGRSPGVVESVAIGAVVAWFEKRVDDGPIEIVIGILVPYVAYLAGQRAHASGVLSVIACGMYMSRKSVEIYTPNVRLQTAAVWDALTFVLNGIVFVLIGLQLPYVMAEIGGMSRLQLVEYGVGFSVVMIAVRMLWVFGETYAAYGLRRWVLKKTVEAPEARGVFIVGFTGMRGVLSLAAAFTLPYSLPGGEPFAQRSMIVFLTFCLIVATLVVQGLSLPWLIARLGLADPDRVSGEEDEARKVMLREAMVHLDRARARQSRKDAAGVSGADGASDAVFDEVTGLYQMRLNALPISRQEAVAMQVDPARLRQVMLETVQVERATLIRLRDQGQIDDEVMRALQRELDLSESRMYTGASHVH